MKKSTAVVYQQCAVCRERLHAEKQQQQSLWEVHPAAARQVRPRLFFSISPSDDTWSTCRFLIKESAVSRRVGADLSAGKDQGVLSASQREELPHLLPGDSSVNICFLTTQVFTCILRGVYVSDDERRHR